MAGLGRKAKNVHQLGQVSDPGLLTEHFALTRETTSQTGRAVQPPHQMTGGSLSLCSHFPPSEVQSFRPV